MQLVLAVLVKPEFNAAEHEDVKKRLDKLKGAGALPAGAAPAAAPAAPAAAAPATAPSARDIARKTY